MSHVLVVARWQYEMMLDHVVGLRRAIGDHEPDVAKSVYVLTPHEQLVEYASSLVGPCEIEVLEEPT